MSIPRSVILKLSALLTLLFLSLPSAMGMHHMLQGHDHIDHCENVSSVHIHEQQLDCDLYDVTMDNAVSYAFAKAELITPPSFNQKPTSIRTIAAQQLISTTLLRGPPVS